MFQGQVGVNRRGDWRAGLLWERIGPVLRLLKESLAKSPGCFEDSHGISADDSFGGCGLTCILLWDTRGGLGVPTDETIGGWKP